VDIVHWLFDAQIHFGSQSIYWRELIGNIFGLASALGGMRRKVWAWPVGIVGNVLLFTVFLGSAFGEPNAVNLLGQAGRQIVFIIVSIYGWYRWTRRDGADATTITPHWASARARVALVVVYLVGTFGFYFIFQALGSFSPFADAWVFMGSLLATYGMAKGWVEFWLIWVAVDVVGVPLLFSAGYYATGLMYVVYGAFTLTGFFVWRNQRVRPSSAVVVEG
jgi:nicotinamide mononucleotide transporter